MPRGKKSTYALAEDGDGGLAPVRVDQLRDSLSPVSGVSTSTGREIAALECLRQFDARTDGWARIIPTGDGKQGYCKWKFTRGPHRGKYVMWAYGYGDILGGISGLALKLDDVDNGRLKPSHDQYGGDGWE